MEATPSVKRTTQVVVTSDKMNKSRVGEIIHIVKHPVVGKFIKRRSKLMFHDEGNLSKIGDEVLIRECAPKSARKSFELVEIKKQKEV